MASRLVVYRPNSMPSLGSDQLYLHLELQAISNAIQGLIIASDTNAADIAARTVAPDTSWQTFSYVNSWVDYGAPYGPAGYRKLPSGLVVLKGLVQSGVASTIATGYRPGHQGLFNMQTNPNVACRVDVSTAGVISHTGGSAGWLSLNGITFLAEA